MNAIMISASSDIGSAICEDWCRKGWNVFGTYRQFSPALESMKARYELNLVQCDLLDNKSISMATESLTTQCREWDVLLFAPSRQEPVGNFHEVDFNDWAEGVQVNFISQMKMLHHLLPNRRRNSEVPPVVLFFAGGGVNNAVVRYSSYTISKIALVKMVELLDAEVKDTRFVIVGPGWVKTKSHEPTLRLGAEFAGENYQRTLDKLQGNECTPMGDIVECCNWLISTNCNDVSGRNYSVVSDQWGTQQLENELKNDFDMYKLRRFKNSWL